MLKYEEFEKVMVHILCHDSYYRDRGVELLMVREYPEFTLKMLEKIVEAEYLEKLYELDTDNEVNFKKHMDSDLSDLQDKDEIVSGWKEELEDLESEAPPTNTDTKEDT